MNMVAGPTRTRRVRIGLVTLPILVAASVALGLTAGSVGAAPARAATTAATNAPPPPLTWSGPVALEKAPYQEGNPLADISCPSAHLCITETGAVDGEGQSYGTVLASTDPTGGPSAWSAPRLAFKGAAGSLSCPATNFCAQISGIGGSVFTSTAPASGKPWVASHGSGGPRALSCPSARLCVGTGANGGIFTSTDPGAGRHAAWHQAVKRGVGTIDAVSCPAASFCAAVSLDGDVLTSSHPTAGPNAWKVFDADGTLQLRDLTCPSARFCIALDNAGRFLYSTDPAGGASRWHAVAEPSIGVADLTCTSASFCAALYGGSLGAQAGVAWSTNPTAGPSSWSQLGLGQYQPAGLSCASASFCAISADTGYVLTSSDPASSAPTWTPADIDGYTSIDDVDCPGTGLCVAADSDGHLFASTRPTGGAGGWHVADVSASSITCPTTTFCAALGGAGLEVSDDPAGGTSAWQSVSAPSGLLRLSCPSPSLCVAFGSDTSEDTLVYSSTDPSGGASTWQEVNFGRGGGVGSLTCPTVSLCVGTSNGDVVTSTDPTGGATAWQFTSLSPLGLGQASVLCPASSLCMGFASSVDPDNSVTYLISSTDPAGGIAAWHLLNGGALGDLLDCPSTAECYQFGGLNPSRGMAASTDPTAASPSWLTSPSTVKLTSVSCPAVSLCVGGYRGGYRGGIEVATPPHPGASLSRLKVSATRLTYGHENSERLAATVSPLYPQYTAVPAGRIVIASRSQTLCRLTLRHGRASCTLTRTALKPGTYWLRIRYPGDRQYAASQSAEIKVKVVR
jgi:Bacterial Ig-like domain (group 3)